MFACVYFYSAHDRLMTSISQFIFDNLLVLRAKIISVFCFVTTEICGNVFSFQMLLFLLKQRENNNYFLSFAKCLVLDINRLIYIRHCGSRSGKTVIIKTCHCTNECLQRRMIYGYVNRNHLCCVRMKH